MKKSKEDMRKEWDALSNTDKARKLIESSEHDSPSAGILDGVMCLLGALRISSA
jgi:uncharacterized protein (DUF362 family)